MDTREDYPVFMPTPSWRRGADGTDLSFDEARLAFHSGQITVHSMAPPPQDTPPPVALATPQRVEAELQLRDQPPEASAGPPDVTREAERLLEHATRRCAAFYRGLDALVYRVQEENLTTRQWEALDALDEAAMGALDAGATVDEAVWRLLEAAGYAVAAEGDNYSEESEDSADLDRRRE